MAPVTGDLSLKSRNLSLKAGSLRQTTAEAVSTKMVNFVPQQKHRTPGLKQKLKLCMKICNCQKICFVWLNLIFAKLYFPEATGIWHIDPIVFLGKSFVRWTKKQRALTAKVKFMVHQPEGFDHFKIPHDEGQSIVVLAYVQVLCLVSGMCNMVFLNELLETWKYMFLFATIPPPKVEELHARFLLKLVVERQKAWQTSDRSRESHGVIDHLDCQVDHEDWNIEIPKQWLFEYIDLESFGVIFLFGPAEKNPIFS